MTRRVVVLLVVVALLAGGATLAGLRFLGGEDGYPEEWDARVQEYVDIVEQERDLAFEHPVHVDFLSEKEFRAQMTEDEEDLTEEDREEIEQTTGLFRALGLLEGDVDLFETSNELRSAGVVGYYSYDDERIRIRGTELTPSVESTLVHELTHALQDQHFDLGTRRKELEEQEDTAAADGFDAVVEGDARRIEAAWREGLTSEELEALQRSDAEQGEQFEKDSEDIPVVLETLMAAPYVFGEALLQVAVEEGGEDAVDDLFRSPPTTEEHQLDPWTLVVDDEQPLDVTEPELAEDEEEFDSGPFGALSLMIVLAERIPAKQALAAADGWGGDAYVAFERDGVSCVRLGYRADTPQDLAEMEEALELWADRLPDSPVRIRPAGETLVFESCDPGVETEPVATGGSRQALQLAASRTYLAAALAGSGFETEAARCGAERLVRRLTLAELTGPDTDPERVQRIVGACVT